jgi:hypothetical protein
MGSGHSLALFMFVGDGNSLSWWRRAGREPARVNHGRKYILISSENCCWPAGLIQHIRLKKSARRGTEPWGPKTHDPSERAQGAKRFWEKLWDLAHYEKLLEIWLSHKFKIVVKLNIPLSPVMEYSNTIDYSFLFYGCKIHWSWHCCSDLFW